MEVAIALGCVLGMMAFLAAWAMIINRARKRKGNTSPDEEVAESEQQLFKLHKSTSDLQELPGVPLEHELDGSPRAELEGTERYAC